MIDGEGWGIERNLSFEPHLSVLLDEINTHTPWVEGEHRLGAGGPELCQLSGIVWLVQRGVHFSHNLALEVPFDAGQGIFTSLVIGAIR